MRGVIVSTCFYGFNSFQYSRNIQTGVHNVQTCLGLKKQDVTICLLLFINLLQLLLIKNYLRKNACKILLWKKLPGNFVPIFPCLRLIPVLMFRFLSSVFSLILKVYQRGDGFLKCIFAFSLLFCLIYLVF